MVISKRALVVGTAIAVVVVAKHARGDDELVRYQPLAAPVHSSSKYTRSFGLRSLLRTNPI